MHINEDFIEYKDCTLCPRNCHVDRNINSGFCRESSKLSIDSALLHKGEEPPISNKNGSGTIFFNGCSLRCPFCQNIQISQQKINNNVYTTKEFILLMEELINKGAENINFVTPDHFLPHIIEGIKHIRNKGYQIPMVYNCSGYQSIKNLEIAKDYIDIFLFDYKFADIKTAEYCIKNKEYPEVCKKALDFVFAKKGNLKLDINGKALSGVIVRHLVMPDFIENSIDVINNLFFSYGPQIFLSLMSQYSNKYLLPGFDRINRRLKKDEYQKVTSLVDELGFQNGYIQEFINYDDEYLPDFKKDQIFNL
jgi:putative pyruvate formate lyase activating enzyme